MKIADKRKAACILMRGGIAQRIILLANDITSGSYKNAIEKGAMIAELIDSCSYDCYWQEKAMNGKYKEWFNFEMLIDGKISREKMMTEING